MPGITNPTEEYFKDGTWAWDPAAPAQWRKLIIDPLTNRLVIDHPGDLEVVQPTPADLCVANHGWTGAAWKKLPLVFGYSGIYYEAEADDDAVAAYDSLTFTVVPPREILCILGGAMFNETNDFDRGLWFFVFGAVTYWVNAELTVLQNQAVRIRSPLILSEGAILYAGFYGNTAGDDLRANIWGYRMLIDE